MHSSFQGGSYSLAGLNERRHAMLPDAEEMAGMRFVPAPFVDLMLVLSRQGFHPHVIQSWTDNEAKNAWLTTKAILERTPKELHNPYWHPLQTKECRADTRGSRKSERFVCLRNTSRS